MKNQIVLTVTLEFDDYVNGTSIVEQIAVAVADALDSSTNVTSPVFPLVGQTDVVSITVENQEHGVNVLR